MDEDISLARREISQQTSINGVEGLAGAFFLFFLWVRLITIVLSQGATRKLFGRQRSSRSMKNF